MSNSDSEIVVANGDPGLMHVQTMHEELGQWIVYAQQCSERGDQAELDNALDTIKGYHLELAKYADLTQGMMGSFEQSMNVMKKEIASLNEQVVELEDNFEEHAADMAQSMVESELDWIFGSEEEESDARIRHTARQMIEYSIDEIKEAERQATENRLREAESIAMHSLAYEKDLGPDSFDLEDDTEVVEE